MGDFDEEAERERLREKYEQDQQDRQATERMSELLLQGATMTNAHCSDCGDPVFRYEGQEFCATCERAVDRDSDDTDGSDGAEGSDETGDAEDIEVTAPSDGARVQFGADGEPATETGSAEPSARDGDGAATDQRGSVPPSSEPGNADRREQAAGSRAPAARGEVGGARASLVRALERFSAEAEATEDPQRAREYLAAAREAAETLAALRR